MTIPNQPTWVLLGPTTSLVVAETNEHAQVGNGITDWPALLEELPTPGDKAEAVTYASVAILAAVNL